MADKGEATPPVDTDTPKKDSLNADDPKEAESKRDMSELITDGKNAKSLHCERCSSKILLPGSAEHVTKEIFLPYMKIKSEQQAATDGETLTDQWVVPDMFTFENIGFTNTVGTAKYLICADCEIGPVGYHDISDKTKFFVAVDRVLHK